MIKLTATIFLKDVTKSATAQRFRINNHPPIRITKHLRKLALGVERARRLLGKQIAITSGYRSAELNARVGGSTRSAHTRGIAADIQVKPLQPAYFAARILVRNRTKLKFDQLIYEYGDRKDHGWIHISFQPRARGEVLSISKKRPQYVIGLRRADARRGPN